MSYKREDDIKRLSGQKPGSTIPTRSQAATGDRQLGTRPKASHADESDYSDDWGADSPDKAQGEAKELRRYNESKQQLKAERAQGKGRTLAEEDDEARGRGGDDALDSLW